MSHLEYLDKQKATMRLTHMHRTAGWAKQFKTYGNLAIVSILGTEMVGTNDQAIAELFVKESEYFTKKIGNTLKEIKDLGGNGNVMSCFLLLRHIEQILCPQVSSQPTHLTRNGN